MGIHIYFWPDVRSCPPLSKHWTQPCSLRSVMLGENREDLPLTKAAEYLLHEYRSAASGTRHRSWSRPSILDALTNYCIRQKTGLFLAAGVATLVFLISKIIIRGPGLLVIFEG